MKTKNLSNQFSNLIFYLLILLLPTQFGKHFWPSFAFVSGVQVDYLSPTLYFTDILIILLFLSTALNKRFSISHFSFSIDFPFVKLSHRSRNAKWQMVNGKFALLVIITLIISTVFSKYPISAGYGTLKLLEMLFFGWYVATHVNKKNIKTIAFLFCFPLFFESLLAIAQFAKQGSLDSIFYFFGERTFTGQTPGIANVSLAGELQLRPYGTFPHPNVLAAYLLIGIIFVSSSMYHVVSKKRAFVWITIIVSAIALLLSLSRIAILLGVVFGIFFIIQKLRFHKKKIKPIFYVLLPTCYLLLVLSPLGSRFTSFSLGDEAVTQRAFLMQQATIMIAQSPLFGVGLHNFFYHLSSATLWQNPYLLLQPVHNIYLLIAAETGLVGLGLFLYFIFLTYKKLQSKKSIIHNSCFMLLSIILVLGLFDHYFLTLQQGQLLFAFVLGLCWMKQ